MGLINRACLVLLVAAAVACAPTDPQPPPAPTPSAAVVSEDDPGWDCVRMGNGRCGLGPLGRRQ